MTRHESFAVPTYLPVPYASTARKLTCRHQSPAWTSQTIQRQGNDERNPLFQRYGFQQVYIDATRWVDDINQNHWPILCTDNLPVRQFHCQRPFYVIAVAPADRCFPSQHRLSREAKVQGFLRQNGIDCPEPFGRLVEYLYIGNLAGRGIFDNDTIKHGRRPCTCQQNQNKRKTGKPL